MSEQEKYPYLAKMPRKTYPDTEFHKRMRELPPLTNRFGSLINRFEPAPKHDGRLDERPQHDDYHATVEIQEDYGLCDGSKLVEIAGGHGDCENSRVWLEPAQALSLLAWLQQEKPELERLVKEQGE